MSEHINNVSQRKEIIKNILKQLHSGKSVEDVREEFDRLASQISYGEIVEIEQMLIDEGMPPEEIQNLCDVHVAVFKKSLDAQTESGSLPGHPVFTLRDENRLLEKTLDNLSGLLQKGLAGDSSSLDAFWMQAQKLSDFNRHYLRKEELLFPYLEKAGFYGPSKVMWGLHDDIRKLLQELMAAKGGSRREIQQAFSNLETMMREMVYKEEKILFPEMLSRFTDEDWESIAAQEDEIGYFITRPGNQWRPKAKAGREAKAMPEESAMGEQLPLQTGALTLKQIDLLLRSLPVDVTFVDEKDTVRYFSQTRERIFSRTPAIIGRKVENCHPPQSVGRVMQIVDDFRSGKRDSAEFWIQMGGRFILIRYFAMRDETGTFRGTLEVSQDVTGIRALQGEKRLLD